MGNKLYKMMACPQCRQALAYKSGKLKCSKKHEFKVVGGVPLMSELDPYLEIEAKAWEDEWHKGVSKRAMASYKKNMKIFKKLGFWEESGEAAGFIPSKADWTVLDLGCGNGVSTANIKGKNVIGLDLSSNQMVRAKKKFRNRSFVVGDATKIPFSDNSFDLVVAINILHHVSSPTKTLKEVYRVLKKGGRFLSVDPNLYNPIGFVGRGLFQLLPIKKLFPSFPQFALGEKEIQFSKKQYDTLFARSPFENYKIIPHRIERLLFFLTILFPPIINLPGYEKLLTFTSRAGNSLVKIPPFDNICYFWLGEATKL